MTHSSRSTRSVFAIAALGAAITAACSSTEPRALVPSRLEPLTPTHLTGTVGTEVSPAPMVRVLDQDGLPVSGVIVHFELPGDDVRPNFNSSSTTNADGVASAASWKLGVVAGTHVLRARAAGVKDVEFTAEAAPGPVAQLDRISGGDQWQVPGAALLLPLRVRVQDAFDNPKAGESVRFTVISGGGSLAVDVGVTDLDGYATSGAWTLGPALGPQQVNARVGTVEAAFIAQTCDAANCPRPPDRSSMLAFVSERDGNSEIYAMHLDGTGLQRLTDNPASDVDPAWSPDGRRIAFASNRVGGSDIYVMDADGSNLVRRTDSGFNESPAWSPDGRRIAFSSLRGGQTGIYVMNVDGDWASPTRVGYDIGWNVYPAWSPDGRRIAFTSDWRAYDILFDVYVSNADGSNIRSLLAGPFIGNDAPTYYFQPSWSPNGARVAVVVCGHAWDTCYPDSQLAVANSDGSQLVTLAKAGGFAHPTWSPDGSMLAYAVKSCRECQGSLRTVSSDGRTNQFVFANGHSPAWRP